MTPTKRKLSKSACEKYMQCPASFDYHYNQKIRPIKVGSPLVFGSGIDAGLNAILLKTGDHIHAYYQEVAKTPFGKMLPNEGDYDHELLTDFDKTILLEGVKLYGYTGNDVDDLAYNLLARIKQREELSENQYKAVDYLCRTSLAKKAELMFDAYKKQVLPRIEKVHNVQKQSGPGYLDATIGWQGIDKVIIDHKTSSKRYPDNAVEFSAQLAMYASEENVFDVANVVFLKQIKKNREKICSLCGNNGTGKRHKTCDEQIDGTRCDGEWTETIAPEAEIQIVQGKITQEAMNVASELQREVQRAVDAKIFPCNVQACNNQFGKPCVYRDLKWKGDMAGLEKVGKK